MFRDLLYFFEHPVKALEPYPFGLVIFIGFVALFGSVLWCFLPSGTLEPRRNGIFDRPKE